MAALDVCVVRGDSALFSTVGKSEALLEGVASLIFVLGSRTNVGAVGEGKKLLESAASIPDWLAVLVPSVSSEGLLSQRWRAVEAGEMQGRVLS